ncbi:L-histidine N(alpha)-methyltransferase [Dactylosporangium salmoneum]|uniref:L-histidine N(alpha)-methyltransferase n=1 Tax=Dactylosporangium salmoneum TaxID=53361 RepID=UPI0031D26391
MKYAYAGSAAYTHDRYASTADYSAMMASAANESETLLMSGVRDLDLRDLAEVGPGNGRHSVAFLRGLAERGRAPRRYLGVDFSATLLNIAAERIRAQAGAGLAVDTAVWDVEDRPSPCLERWRSGAGPVVVCMLGGTLGNLESPVQVLRNLADGLCSGDVLLLTVLLRPATAAVESTMSAYRTEAFRCAALEPLVAAGLRPADMRLTLTYDDSAVVGEVTLLRDARVGRTRLPRGHQFRCFLSRRFAGDEVIRLLYDSGWAVRAVRVDEADHHMTLVAARK